MDTHQLRGLRLAHAFAHSGNVAACNRISEWNEVDARIQQLTSFLRFGRAQLR
jgi:hypothetical protein